MFAARRSVQRLAQWRGLATVAVDSGAPTSSLTVVVKAGSRYEPSQGVANALKNFAFKVCFLFSFYLSSSSLLEEEIV